MGQKRDAHPTSVNSTATPGDYTEAARVGRIYRGYARSPRRRRAWAADNPGNCAIRAELFEAVLDEAGPELAGGGEVLDVGCGTGYWLAELAGAGVDPSRLTGIDVLPERVAAARSRAPGTMVVHGDARALPFDDDRFALVLLFTVLSSLGSAENARRALGEARRVVGPGGVLLCYETRIPNPLNWRVRRLHDTDLDDAGLRPRTERLITVLPPLARRLGTRTTMLYSLLARLNPIQSHRLVAFRNP